MAIREGDTVLYKGIQREVTDVDPSDDTIMVAGIERWISISEVIKLPGQGSDDDDDEEDEEEEED